MSRDIGDAIRRVRELRTCFLTDTPAVAYENTKVMIDRFWPLDNAQLDASRYEPHIYRPNSKAKDQIRENEKRIHSAIIAQLSILDWDYADNRGKTRDQLIDELERDLALMQKDGLHPYERYVERRTEPAITAETAWHYRSLSSKIRRQLFDTGLSIAVPTKKRTGRKRQNPVDTNTILRTAPFLRSRDHWRPEHIFKACKVLHEVSEWIDEQGPNEPLVMVYTQRYRLADLYVSDSKVAPDYFSAKIAIAISSANHLSAGTDEYEPNDDVARGAFLYYGLYLQSIRAAQKKTASAIRAVFLNKLLKIQ